MALYHWTPIVVLGHSTRDFEFERQATAFNCCTDFSHSATRFQLVKFRVTTFPKKIRQFRWRLAGFGAVDSQSDSQSIQAPKTTSIFVAASRLTNGRTVEYVSIVRLI
jgi:hypothetical protein